MANLGSDGPPTLAAMASNLKSDGLQPTSDGGSAFLHVSTARPIPVISQTPSHFVSRAVLRLGF